MPFTLIMPKLSPTMEEGSIVKWHKKVGDYVESGELLLEVATDKATVEYNAIDEGWLRKIIVEEGKEAKVNQVIALFTEKQEESIEGYKLPELPKKEVQVEKEEIKKEEPEQPKPSAAQVASMRQPAFIPEVPLEKEKISFSPSKEGRILASPLARKLAKEKGLDLSTVKGSGPNQRVMSRDLAQAKPLGGFGFVRGEKPKIPSGSYTEEALTPMRKVISQRLQEAKSFIPHFYVQQTIQAQPLVDLREQLRNLEIVVSINDLVIKGCALALKQHPTINSGFNSVNNTLIHYQTIDISVAVSVQGGLITPIVRYADYKNLSEISSEVRALAKKAKEGKLEAHEYKGGSFTISNLGMHGITNFQAIINPPQGAILAVGGITEVPIVKNQAIVVGKVMNLTLSVDHRVIDGVAAAEFLKTLQRYLENPVSLVLQ